MPKFDPKVKYDYLLKWIDSDVTKTLIDGSIPGVSNAAQELKTALLAHTDCEDLNTTNTVMEKLEAFNQSIADNDAVLAGRDGIKAYLEYGKSLAKYAQLTADRELDSFNIVGNEHLTEDYGASGIATLNANKVPKTLAELNTSLCTLGYDKLWNSLAKRVDLECRTNCYLIKDEEVKTLSDDITNANSELKASIRTVQDNAYKNQEMYNNYENTFSDENYGKMSVARRTLDWQNDALERGWDPSKIDEFEMHRRIHESIFYSPDYDTMNSNYNGLANLGDYSKKYLDEYNPLNIKFTDRRDFHEKFLHMNSMVHNTLLELDNSVREQRELSDYNDENSDKEIQDYDKVRLAKYGKSEKKIIEKGKEAPDTVEKYKEDLDRHADFDDTQHEYHEIYHRRNKIYTLSIFHNLYKRKKDDRDIYGVAGDRFDKYAYNVNHLHGDENEKKQYTKYLFNIKTNVGAQNVLENAGIERSDLANRVRKRIKKHDEDTFYSDNKYMGKFYVSLKHTSFLYTNDEDNSYLNMTYNEMSEAYAELVKSSRELKNNAPKLANRFKYGHGNDKITERGTDDIAKAYIIGYNSKFELGINAVGKFNQTENRSSYMLYQALDVGTGKREYEKKAMKTRLKAIEDFYGDFNAKNDAISDFLEDNKDRTKNVTRARDDKRSPSYRKMISALELLEKVRDPEHYEEFTPEEMMMAFENAKIATKEYADSHSGMSRLLGRGNKAEGKKRAQDARAIYDDLVYIESDIKSMYMHLSFMPKGMKMGEAKKMCNDVIAEIDQGVPSNGLNAMDAQGREKGRIGLDYEGTYRNTVDINELLDKNVDARNLYGIGSRQAIRNLDLDALNAENQPANDLIGDADEGLDIINVKSNRESVTTEAEDEKDKIINTGNFIIDTSSGKKEDQVDEEYEDCKKAVDDSAKDINTAAKNGDTGKFKSALNTHIFTVKSMCECDKFKRKPSDKDMQKTLDEVADLTAGLLAAKELQTCIKSDMTGEQLKGISFENQKAKIKNSHEFKNMMQGGDPWQKARDIIIKLTTKKDDLVYSSYVNKKMENRQPGSNRSSIKSTNTINMDKKKTEVSNGNKSIIK